MSIQWALFSIAIFQGIMLGVIVLRSPIFKSNANKYLAFAVIGLSVVLLCLASEITETYQESLLLQVLNVFCSGALFPVLILLFMVNQVEHPFRDSPKRYALFVPHVLTVVVAGLNAVIDWNVAQVFLDITGGFLFLLVLLFIPTVLIYAYSFIKYSNNRQEKRWLRQLWFLVFTVVTTWVASIFLAIFSYMEIASMMSTISLSSIFLIHWITYVGIFKFRLAKDQEEIRALIKKWKSGAVKTIAPEPPLDTVDNEKRIASLTKDNLYFKKLEALCINERIYLDNTLDRAQVAEMLGISPSYISQLVNTITGDNFSTYINRYRVEAVKAMITDPEFDNYSLLAIGLESGFSSKTTFYTAFKKLTGMTPNMYRKAQK